jgi:4-amino-4-deoxy-L-arabinose transferase-like glycosyltransferase
MAASAVYEQSSAPPLLDEPIVAPLAPGQRWRWRLAVAGVLALALVLRLWGIKQGLPYAYNLDEYGHFVPHAIGVFGHSLSPRYFNNPPAYTYLLHLIYAVWFGGRTGVAHAYAVNPTEVFVIARVTAALLGTVAVWLLYLTGARLIDRRAGLLAAGLMAVAFLPVFYSHLALNDVPTLAPLTLSLFGTAGVLRMGRPIDYVIAGLGLGLACATKYTGGIVVVPLLVAAGAQYVAPGGRRSALIGVAIAAGVALAAFLIAAPYSLLDFSAFRNGLAHQSATADDASGKLGQQHSGISYYLWTLTWGVGWVPAIGALAGAIALWRDERRLSLLLGPAPILFLIFLGSQGRYFGRWLMPILPIVALLSAYAVLEAAEWLGRRRPELRPTLIAVAVVALCGQTIVHSVHSGLVLSRADTRNTTRAWMVAHIPQCARIVVEPLFPDPWATDIGHPSACPGNSGARWSKFPATRTQVASDGTLALGAGPVISIENYERTLRPDLIDLYQRYRYCWVISGSTQSGRAYATPRQVPQAIAYYAALRQRGQLVYQASPYAANERSVPFNFDWAFDYYPLAYERPGPVMSIYHLTGGACA